MARLSQTTIEAIAEKMTSKTKEAVDQLKKDYQELVTVIYEDQIPQAVKDFAKKYPDFVRTDRSIKLDGHGFRWQYIDAPRKVVCSGGHAAIELNDKIADKIKKAIHKHTDALESYQTLLRETKQALSALGTHNRIKENLPEAVPFLPPPMSNALVVNFTSLQKKLKLQPDTKKIAAVTN